VTCGANNKGIHLRGGLQDRIKDCTVSVEPFFTDPDNKGECLAAICGVGKTLTFFLAHTTLNFVLPSIHTSN
jgi:hypothetical protein